MLIYVLYIYTLLSFICWPTILDKPCWDRYEWWQYHYIYYTSNVNNKFYSLDPPYPHVNVVFSFRIDAAVLLWKQLCFGYAKLIRGVGSKIMKIYK